MVNGKGPNMCRGLVMIRTFSPLKDTCMLGFHAWKILRASGSRIQPFSALACSIISKN